MAWVEHVKKFAAKNSTSYGMALKSVECREQYQAGKIKPNEVVIEKSMKPEKLEKQEVSEKIKKVPKQKESQLAVVKPKKNTRKVPKVVDDIYEDEFIEPFGAREFVESTEA